MPLTPHQINDQRNVDQIVELRNAVGELQQRLQRLELIVKKYLTDYDRGAGGKQ